MDPRGRPAEGGPGPFADQPPSRRYWVGFPAAATGRRPRARWSRLGTIMVLIGVAEVVVVAGVVTDWFGLGPDLARHSGGSPATPTGPNPNPFAEKVDSLRTTIAYTGNTSGYFPGLASAQVCGHCPVLPTIDWGHSPPVAVVAIFFNVTNAGGAFHEITNFTLTASQANQSRVFDLFGIYCCAPNDFDEDVDFVGVTPGQTVGIEAYLTATDIPSSGGAGYDLILAMVSST